MHINSGKIPNRKRYERWFAEGIPLFNNLGISSANRKYIAQRDRSLRHQGKVLQARKDIRQHSDQSGGHNDLQS